MRKKKTKTEKTMKKRMGKRIQKQTIGPDIWNENGKRSKKKKKLARVTSVPDT